MLTLPIWIGPTRDPLAADRMYQEAMAWERRDRDVPPNAKVTVQTIREFQGRINYGNISSSQSEVARTGRRFGVILKVTDYTASNQYPELAEILVLCFQQYEEMVTGVYLMLDDYQQTPFVEAIIERLIAALVGESQESTRGIEGAPSIPSKNERKLSSSDTDTKDDRGASIPPKYLRYFRDKNYWLKHIEQARSLYREGTKIVDYCADCGIDKDDWHAAERGFVLYGNLEEDLRTKRSPRSPSSTT